MHHNNAKKHQQKAFQLLAGPKCAILFWTSSRHFWPWGRRATRTPRARPTPGSTCRTAPSARSCCRTPGCSWRSGQRTQTTESASGRSPGTAARGSPASPGSRPPCSAGCRLKSGVVMWWCSVWGEIVPKKNHVGYRKERVENRKSLCK